MNNNQEFFNWYNFEATTEEKTVVEKMGMFEELFSDMIFSSGTKTGDFLKCYTKPADSEDDNWIECETDIPEEMEYFSPTNYRIRVEPLPDGVGGQFNKLTKEITIIPQNINSDSIILHEMIHLYEDMIESQKPFYRDIIFFLLYKDLQQHIPDLDKYITDHGQIFNQQALEHIGGVHDILFFLKSLDLDLKQGYKLGTVFSYGMAEELNQ